MSDLQDIYLKDEEYLKLVKEYVRAYGKVVDALPRKKKALIVDFNEVTEKVITRRIYLAMENLQKSQSEEQKIKRKKWWEKWMGL